MDREKGRIKINKEKLKKRIGPVLGVVFWLAVWQLVSMRVGNHILAASPVQTIKALFGLLFSAGFWKSVVSSFVKIAFGFLLGVTVGIVLAVLAAAFRFVRYGVTPLLRLIKAVPVASFIILALLWVSSKRLSVLISFLMVLPVIYTNVFQGIVSTDKELCEMADVFRLGFGKRLRYIYLPSVLPYFVSACSVALGFCFKSGIAAEIIGLPDNSIGEKLYEAKLYLMTPELFAWTAVIICISVGFEHAVMYVIRMAARRLCGCGGESAGGLRAKSARAKKPAEEGENGFGTYAADNSEEGIVATKALTGDFGECDAAKEAPTTDGGERDAVKEAPTTDWGKRDDVKEAPTMSWKEQDVGKAKLSSAADGKSEAKRAGEGTLGRRAAERGRAAVKQGDMAFLHGLQAEKQGNEAARQGIQAEKQGMQAAKQGSRAEEQGKKAKERGADANVGTENYDSLREEIKACGETEREALFAKGPLSEQGMEERNRPLSEQGSEKRENASCYGLFDVSKSFGEKKVLQHFTLRLCEGVTALMGPSGCGKSTAGKLLLSLETPEEGTVTVPKECGAVFQEDRLCMEFDAVTNVAMVCKDRDRAKRALFEVGLSEVVGKPVAEFSGGMKRRTAIVRAVLSDAKLLVLDEPFTGLDENGRQRMMEWVKENSSGRSVLLITHHAEEAEAMAQRIISPE